MRIPTTGVMILALSGALLAARNATTPAKDTAQPGRAIAAGAADAAGAHFGERVVAAGIDDGNRKPHFLLSEVIEHALQHHGVVFDLFFVVCRDVGR